MSRILLVEDDGDLAAGLLFTFEEEGFETLYASDAAQARAAFAKPFDLAVLDVLLPDGNGYSLCRELRANSAVPVIFLTSCDDEANIVRGLDGGGDDYVTKPFRVKVLLSRIRACLRRESPENADFLSCGDIRLDAVQCRASAAGAELALTATEYRLLALFVRNKGLTLTRAQLLGRLWDDKGEFVDDNTLSVHIRHLREKLEAAESRAVIRTIRGLGYRLEEKL